MNSDSAIPMSVFVCQNVILNYNSDKQIEQLGEKLNSCFISGGVQGV